MAPLETPLLAASLREEVGSKVSGHFNRRGGANDDAELEVVRQDSRQRGHMPVDHGTIFPPCVFIPRWPKVLMSIAFCTALTLCCTVWKARLESHGFSTETLLRYLSLPLVSVAFTYAHIWAALWMTFYPLEFFGVPGTQIPENPLGLGWQGIVPSKVRKMGTVVIRTLLEKLITLEEVFAGIDPDRLMQEIDKPLHEALWQAIDTLGQEEAPAVWARIPPIVKDELALRVHEEAPQLMRDFIAQLKMDVGRVFDIEHMVVSALMRDKALIVHMFLSCGYHELEFIRDTGALMGLFFGVVQMVQQYFYPLGWLLPVFSTVVGFLTNWLALKMIFYPVNPKRLCGGRMVLHGVFLKRQHEVAPQYAQIFAEKVASAQLLIPAMFCGKRSDKFIGMMVDHVDAAVERFAGMFKPVLGKPSYERAKQVAAQNLISTLPEAFLAADEYLDHAMALKPLLTKRVRAMSSADFENLLHPVFQEDEWILILLGGVLGYIVGMTQWYVLGG